MQDKKTDKKHNLRCYFCMNSDVSIEFLYKDINRLKRYLNERGMIIPKLKTRLCSYHQRKLSNAVKKARFLALLPVAGKRSL